MTQRPAVVVAVLAGMFALVAPLVRAAEATKADVKCEMRFSLRGWSAFYKTASGEGTVKCSNGQSARVKIKVTGGGLTVGKSEIPDATGKFTPVADISEIYGAYAASEAHAGVVKSSTAQAMTKGRVSLAVAGTGKGYDLGVDITKFEIEPLK